MDDNDDNMAFDSSSPLLVVNDLQTNNKTRLYEPKKKLKWSDLLQMRYLIILLCMFGTFNIYATRVSISIGLVCMVNHTANLQHSRHQNYPNLTAPSCFLNEKPAASNGSHTNLIRSEDGPFVWDEEVQGIILSSFFWGYITTQFAGGYMADRYGGKWVWGFTLLTSSLLTMLIPFAAHFGSTLLIYLRILCGAAQGFTFPALFSIISKWTTVQERTTMATISQIGISLGIVVTYSLAPVLCTSQLFGGWPSLFYLIGFLGVVWFALWSLLMYDHPSEHPWITQKEKSYVVNSNMCASEPHLIQVPWKKLLISTPLWAVCICDFCQSYKYFMMITQLPTYLKVVLNFNLHENGIINSINPLLSPVFAVFFGCMADYLRSREKISVSALRKSITFTDSIITSSCLLVITLLSCQKTEIVILILISSFMENLSSAGISMAPYDLAPNFAGTVKGIVQTFSALGGILAPYVIGILTKNNNTKSAWDMSFYTALGLYFFGGMVFVIFGSGNIQPWNNVKDIATDSNRKEDEYVIIYARKNQMTNEHLIATK